MYSIATPEAEAETLTRQRLASFYALSQHMQSGHSVPDMFGVVIAMALRLTGAQRGLLLLVGDKAEGESPSKQVAAAAPFPPHQALSLVSRAVLDDALRHAAPRLVEHIAHDERYRHTSPPPEVCSVVVVPLVSACVLVGALYLDHDQPGAFQPEDVDFLIAFATPVLLMHHREREHQQQIAELSSQAQAQNRHLTYLNDIGIALTRSLNLSHILQVIIEGVNALLETERSSVFLIDEETNELVLRYSNEGPNDIRLPAPWQGVAGWVATHDTPTLVNDTRSDSRYLRQFALDIGYEAHSILCVPLKVEGRVIGVVEVLNKIGGQSFTHRHQELLTDLTRWAAIALHNARLYEERVQAYQRLAAEQQRRIAAETRGAMAAVILDIGHTMNNIIGAIRVWALTLEGEAIPESSRQLITKIRENAEEAIELIRTMRGPLEHATIAATNVAECLDNAMHSCWWPDTITVHTEYASTLPLVQANRTRLEAVFQNVLSNAIQAIGHEAGHITITAHCTDEGWVEVQICDDGPGIAPEVRDQLFTPGVSDKDGSLGIGLWLVETFIRQFGGKIVWYSTVGEGTTFVITLPPME